MKAGLTVAIAAALFVSGVGVGFSAQKLPPGSALYAGKSPADAGDALLASARVLAEDGSFENIGVGRVLYLSGRKAEGQAIFDRYSGAKADPGDLLRIARVYREAGEGAKARALFDRFLASSEVDERETAEIGAYYLLDGDRATAERLFDRSMKIERANTWAQLRMAAAYLGVQPQQ